MGILLFIVLWYLCGFVTIAITEIILQKYSCYTGTPITYGYMLICSWVGAFIIPVSICTIVAIEYKRQSIRGSKISRFLNKPFVNKE